MAATRGVRRGGVGSREEEEEEGEEGAAVSTGGKGRRKQINTGEQEGPANERTDAKSSADQRRDALQSTLLCVSPPCRLSWTINLGVRKTLESFIRLLLVGRCLEIVTAGF